jgi:surfeit locus 1 family protein
VNGDARQPARAVAPAGALLLLAVLFAALGVWQLERREWKHALIAAVDSRIHALPVPAPGPSEWGSLSADKDAYRRVRITGRFLHGRSTLVRAVSDLGAGYWVLTPFDTGGFIVLVNRGFVAPEHQAEAQVGPAGTVTVTGLLRTTEPGGGFLRHNDPIVGRWYSRDVAAIAKARGLGKTAPYFVDADAAMNAPGAPVGGLTVVNFPDNHAAYALTWFALALLSLGAAWRLLRPARGPAATSA